MTDEPEDDMPDDEKAFVINLPTFTDGLRQGALTDCVCPGCRANLLVALAIDMKAIAQDENPAAVAFTLAGALARFMVDHDVDPDRAVSVFSRILTTVIKERAEQSGPVGHA